jgi:lipopolysaccharide/colanic/teichoic acid biosynthesis glycosyltransferase
VEAGLSANPTSFGVSEGDAISGFLKLHEPQSRIDPENVSATALRSMRKNELVDDPQLRPLSSWSRSPLKRTFDIVSVLSFSPLLILVHMLIGVAVCFTSRGPILFRQKRVGRNGRTFTIFKFRTMIDRRGVDDRPAVTTSDNQGFTAVGPFLRRWKLDELPQLVNVLRGDMSLVGPRPKIPEHQMLSLNCRPGITGAATIVFAREEFELAKICPDRLDAYYRAVVLPAKHQLDNRYMSSATFTSDLRLILKSVFRDWGEGALRSLLSSKESTAPYSFRAIEEDISQLT